VIEALQQTLAAANRPSYILETGDGTRLLILPHGARVLGLYTAGVDENFYWTNPDLERAASATQLFSSPGWQNTGGDRTWISPELDIFFPGYPDTIRHQVPPALDSAGYEVLHKPNSMGLRRTLRLYVARTYREHEFELLKWIEPAPNPLRREPRHRDLLKGVRYAGYTQNTKLALTGDIARKPVSAGIWNLIQLPHGGEMIVPTYVRTEPRVLWGDIPADRLVSEDRAWRLKMDFSGEHKIALRAVDLTGRAAYLRHSGGTWWLVIRNFSVNPSGEYVDVPKDAPNDLGYAFHAVNILSSLGAFCELEHHSPAFGRHETDASVTDTSQVWAYCGPADAIKAIGKLLLGVEL
jgi:hypothetical protein